MPPSRYRQTGVRAFMETQEMPSGGAVASASGVIDVEVVTASQAAGVYSNGVEYIPFVQGAGDTMAFQFRAPATGDVVVRICYAMSAANGGNVELTMDRLIASDDDDPSAALTAGTAFVVTPGNDANKHTIDAAETAHTTLTVVENDIVRCSLERTVAGNDTHTGDMRVLNISAVPV